MEHLADHPVFEDRGAGYVTGIPEGSNIEKALLEASPQLTLVIEYLKSGRGLSGLIAHTVLGVTSLTTRIAELRKMGLPIAGKWHKDHSGKRFMVYKFDPTSEPTDEPLFLKDHPELPDAS